jgi:hypothetical protein
MKSNYERNREGLESVLKRVARSYAMGRIEKNKFDKFIKTMESAFTQLEGIENGEAEIHTATREGS